MNKLFSEKVVKLVSILWIVFIGSLIGFKWKNLIDLDLNEIGDFLAGVFAPLGFFWLIAGFHQQGKGLEQNSEALKLQSQELEESTKALKLQVQEMRSSVEQQSRLAKVYEEELQQKHFQVQPYFEYAFRLTKNYLIEEPICDEDDNVIDTYEERRIEFTLTIINLGDTARNMTIRSRKGQPYIQRKQYKLEHSENFVMTFEIDSQLAEDLNGGNYDLSRLFKIKYQDIYGKYYEEFIECNLVSGVDNDTDEVHLYDTFKIISKDEALAREI